MGVCMKKLFVVFGLFIGSLFCSANPATAKNDTVVISDLYKAMEFDTYFSGIFSSLAKEDIREMMADDPNFKPICQDIKVMIVNNQICDVKSVVPILKRYGSLRHIMNYKKMFHIYFQEIKARLTWAKTIYYIIDDNGNFVYVEFKNMYDGRHLVFDQSLLKNVSVNKHMFKIYKGYDFTK